MPKIDIQQLAAQLRSGKIGSLYLIYGPEFYLVRSAVEMLKEALKKEAGGEVHIDSFEGGKARWEDVENSLMTRPMWTKRRVVYLSAVEKLSEGDQERIVSYIERPATNVTLILVAAKADGRKRLVQAAIKNGQVIECKPFYESQLPQWINMEARKRGRQISLEAASYLAELVGNNLAGLADALDKICLYIGRKPIIETHDVEEVLTETTRKSIFELCNALGKRDLKGAIRVLENLLSFGENPILVFNMILRHWRLLIKVKELTSRTRELPDEKSLAGILKIHPFFVKDYLEQSGNFTLKSLRDTFRTFWEADRKLKSSRLSKKIILDRLLLDIASAKGG